MDYNYFFLEEVPSRLKKLRNDARPGWGSMSPAQMLDHLRVGIKMSLENTDGEIVTPEEKLPAYKKFLMSERPFKRDLRKPAFYEIHENGSAKDLEGLKVELLKALVEMQAYFEKNGEHTAVHPNFGRLNTEEWKHLHQKHISHHFSQFGLI